jgi:hypothetical protein
MFQGSLSVVVVLGPALYFVVREISKIQAGSYIAAFKEACTFFAWHFVKATDLSFTLLNTVINSVSVYVSDLTTCSATSSHLEAGHTMC